jgi:hypothetical protein
VRVFPVNFSRTEPNAVNDDTLWPSHDRSSTSDAWWPRAKRRPSPIRLLAIGAGCKAYLKLFVGELDHLERNDPILMTTGRLDAGSEWERSPIRRVVAERYGYTGWKLLPSEVGRMIRANIFITSDLIEI